MLVQGKYLSYKDDLKEIFEIRKKVFQLEQGVDPKLEFDQLDKIATHVIVHVGSKAVATGRIIYNADTYVIGRVAVIKEERGKKYGDFVVRMLVDRAFMAGAKEVLIGSQINAIGFYEKLGFTTYGEEYVEAGINHKHMKLKNGNLCKECHK
jgi:predicted GNAT family N-acyltransferase